MALLLVEVSPRISIHALRGGCYLKIDTLIVAISIHALREESDADVTSGKCSDTQISIHALREESDGICCRCICSDSKISIHALREESDGFKYDL